MSLSFLSVPHFLLVCSLWFWSCAHCSQLCCGYVFFTYFVLLEINTYMVALSRFLPPTSDFSGVGISSRSTLELLLGVLFPGGALYLLLRSSCGPSLGGTVPRHPRVCFCFFLPCPSLLSFQLSGFGEGVPSLPSWRVWGSHNFRLFWKRWKIPSNFIDSLSGNRLWG